MPCPTCDATMQRVAMVFHCPRCGTLFIDQSDTRRDVYTPLLVQRCREFRALLRHTAELNAWHRFGIGEAIGRPEEGR